MNTSDIRTELHKYIDAGDERLLRMMLALAEEYEKQAEEYTFTPEELQMLEERRQKLLSGESEGYPWLPQIIK